MAKNHSVIFMNDSCECWRRRERNVLLRILAYFSIRAGVLPKRILGALTPPVFGEQSQRVYTDMVGSMVAIVVVIGILHYGHSSKQPSAALFTSPTLSVAAYCAVAPVTFYLLSKLGGASVTLAEITGLLGYSLYGYIFTLSSSLLFDDEDSSVFFFTFVVFGGLSALRVALILLYSIPHPSARLIVCSLIAATHLLFLMFLHFAYMHHTFVYGAARQNKSHYALSASPQSFA